MVLLDHGLYFDLPDDLRVNYARFWLSLMANNSPSVDEERRKYAKLVANIDDAHYPLFQAAITGRAALEGATLSGEESQGAKRRGSMLDVGGNTPEERKMMRTAMVQGGPDGSNLLEQLFVILRNIPRRCVSGSGPGAHVDWLFSRGGSSKLSSLAQDAHDLQGQRLEPVRRGRHSESFRVSC